MKRTQQHESEDTLIVAGEERLGVYTVDVPKGHIISARKFLQENNLGEYILTRVSSPSNTREVCILRSPGQPKITRFNQ
jgi:hypothetical protein